MPSNATDATDRTLVRLVLVGLAVLVLAPLLTMSLAGPMMGGGMWWAHDAGTVGVAPWWGLGMSLVWLAVLVGLGYVVYRAVVAPGAADERADPAMEELRLAYARGDLTDDEFEARRATLTEDREA